MTEKFTLNNIENEDLNLNNEESDYENLVNRLKEISTKITLLGKRFLNKF